MSDFPTREITIYHKNKDNWDRYVIEASYRNTSVINRNKTGTKTSDNTLIRIFNLEGYNSEWFVENEDIIVNKAVNDYVDKAPMTILSEKYGKDNVHKVVSIDKFIFNDEDIGELEHLKIGCV